MAGPGTEWGVAVTLVAGAAAGGGAFIGMGYWGGKLYGCVESLGRSVDTFRKTHDNDITRIDEELKRLEKVKQDINLCNERHDD